MIREIIDQSSYEERERRRRLGRATPAPRSGKRLPSCPPHLNPAATVEWRRIAKALQRAGVLTTFDRAALARLLPGVGPLGRSGRAAPGDPPLVTTPSGYIQQSPWLLIANKQLELMGRYMVELGLTPAARSRVASGAGIPRGYVSPEPIQITRIILDGPATETTPAARAELTLDAPRPLTDEDWAAKHCVRRCVKAVQIQQLALHYRPELTVTA